MLADGWGLGAAVDAAGKATGAFTYGLIGLKGWFLSSAVGDTGVLALFFFMMVFMDTTATIPTGSMAERWAWKNFCLFGLWVALPYCLYANWVWGGGWLAQGGINWGLGHGAVDFAGSGVVHTMGGVIALVGAMIIGPRIGKYDAQGRPQAMPGHNVPLVVLGTFILAFGWFGFNPGSTLAGTDLRISFVVVNTMLAGVVATLTSMVTLMLKGLKPDPTMCCNGMLAGLVAITAPCAFVNPLGAVIIGAVAGWLVVVSVFFWERRGIDDPVGAISVHGTNGIWGVIAVGLFSDGTSNYGGSWNGVPGGVTGLFYGDASQLVAQLMGVATLLGFVFVMSFVLNLFVDWFVGQRVSAKSELQGLDVPEMGAVAYPDFILKPEPALAAV